ncbi:Glucosamine-phosphate N-acetyltransferase-like protein [Polyrhizophydium stewartii]|uniref:Glucosamine 6-phosphate N-acetyltransferase n=1 Tax=Polyrhizophydium stewartii TaxID=2732419 RepID=A0ABR4MWJ0_9FUNG
MFVPPALATPNPQFAADLISSEILAELPDGYIIRPLDLDDFDRGYLETLAELTTVGAVSKQMFADRFAWMKARSNEMCCIVVVEPGTGRIVGIIKQLVHIGKTKGAYKVVLTCSQKNVGFYEKCGLEAKGASMAVYFH